MDDVRTDMQLADDVFVQAVSDDALEAAAGSRWIGSKKTDAGSAWCCGDETILHTCGG
ncbi:hypothetical protein PJK45_13635 [Mycobacterium kansasii]|uniref:Uncharacterized protein n=3 Tax=Mycobacterium kansasii TaxID=1768 RepID=A0A1V3XTG5_MYCKA|nr:hypothetical protein [Mycobacterium kansasii]EUA03948.1 hypothetical protein I547_0246 [Mycobacterium kansasii 824]EUA20843.1 hypothetical protein I545_1005 [Mycobacterium kansasii 662]KEP42885.1 hypothetical protein MKSMC1_19240 [Mycobacterium kansasii]OOK82382.1 hypothetical protein BZL30_0622 [Mycobacterium kansasii]OOK84297.1 hypothetical protein BZL29_1231 [Mycobacterium kansasii]